MTAKTYAPYTLPGGIPKLIQVWEDLRDANTDGYMHGSALLAHIKGGGGVTKATVCSPFTATACALALDPNYAPATGKPDQYVPMCNGGADPLPFGAFYAEHNNNDRPTQSLVDFGVGISVKLTELRRGDLLAIDWMGIPANPPKYPKDIPGGGHTSFVWDVHLDSGGEVDCIQILGSHGEYYGVHIHGCEKARWLKGTPGGLTASKAPGSGSMQKANGPGSKIFVDDDEIVRQGAWYVIPGKKLKDVDQSTFRVQPINVIDAGIPACNAHPYGTSFNVLKGARFNLDGAPPDPYCMKGGPAAPAPDASAPAASAPAPSDGSGDGPPGHVDVPSTVVPASDVQADPDAATKVPPKPATQDDAKPVDWQKWIESALQTFFKAKWINSDPGDATSINDDQSKAAIKDFQTLFKLDVDGIAGPITRAEMMKQLPVCMMVEAAQILLGKLFAGKKLKSNPGPADGTNNPATQAAINEFQGANSLDVNGVCDCDTLKALGDAVDGAAATDAQHGLNPVLTGLYWLGNVVAPGASATLRLQSADVKIGQELKIFLKDSKTAKEVAADAKMVIQDLQSEAQVAIPAVFTLGSQIIARVSAAIDGGKKLELPAAAPLYVANATAPASTAAGTPPATVTADWRSYIDKPSVPDDVINAIKQNRALYPAKKLPLVAAGKYVGALHYDYKPAQDHQTWATQYFQQKVDSKAPPSQVVNRAFVHMLTNEGFPASFQTYDNQIITWGVGLGGMGDGVHAFEALNKDPAMKKLLDDIGVNYGASYYYVVDVVNKKVVGSDKPGKAGLGDDSRHGTPLKAWRQQPDLMSAIIGMSEDPRTRAQVAESQYAVYLSNSAGWPGQDKVATLSLFFMIVHMFQWMPAYAKYGFNVQKEFDKLGGGTPSVDTDAKLAPIIANAFVRRAKSQLPAAKKATYADIYDRTKSHLWAQMVTDGKKENYNPGALTYDPDLAP